MTNTLFDGLLHEEPKDVASTDKKEAANFKQSLVMVCFRISVWTGTTTEQLSVEDGSESMLRKRIVPSEILKPFTDLRNRAKRFCKQHGETYLNGYVMPADCARMALDELKEIRASFIKQRDEHFAHAYEKNAGGTGSRNYSSGLFGSGIRSFPQICPWAYSFQL